MSAGYPWDEDIWVTRLIDWISDRTIDHPLIVGSFSIGLVPVVLTAIFFALTWEGLTLRYVITHLLVILIGFLAPGLIWYWDQTVFRRFVNNVAEVTPETEELERLAAHYSRLFRRRFLVFSGGLVALFLGIFLNNMPYFRTLGVDGIGDPSYWVFVLTGVTWGAVTGIGFHMAVVAVLFIRAVGRLDLEIEPLHPDGLGGLSAIGSFAIWTTMLISIGSLGFPYVFLLTSQGSSGTLIYGGVGFYVLIIGLSFVYPTLYVNRRAQEVRERKLDEMRQRIRELEQQAKDPAQHGSTDEIAKRLEIQRLRDEFQDHATVSLYPLSIGIITRLLSSVFLPIFFILFELWFSSML